MQPKLIKTSNMGEFVQAAWTGKNLSGYEPIDEIVLVLPDGASDMTSGGIQLPPDVVERMSLSAETGVIVAMAEGAFKWNRDRTRPLTGYRPQPGDRVYMKRFAGQVMLGEDQKLYRACSDVEIAAVKRDVRVRSGLTPVSDEDAAAFREYMKTKEPA